MTEKNYDRELLKQKFIEVRGYWDESLEGLLELDPEYFEKHFKFNFYPLEKVGHLRIRKQKNLSISRYMHARHIYMCQESSIFKKLLNWEQRKKN